MLLLQTNPHFSLLDKLPYHGRENFVPVWPWEQGCPDHLASGKLVPGMKPDNKRTTNTYCMTKGNMRHLVEQETSFLDIFTFLAVSYYSILVLTSRAVFLGCITWRCTLKRGWCSVKSPYGSPGQSKSTRHEEKQTQMMSKSRLWSCAWHILDLWNQSWLHL